MRKLYFFLSIVSCVFSAVTSEYIPVLMWQSPENDKASVELPPALSKLSGEQFSDFFLKKAVGSNHIIVFLEENLSVEDFGGSSLGEQYSFVHLRNLSASSSTHFLPSVQSPFKALKNLGFRVKTTKPKDFDFTLPDSEKTIVIFKLGDATPDEDRPDFLKRHDVVIADIYNNLASKYNDLLALYTGHHSSWLEPYLQPNVRKVRQLLQEAPSETNGTFWSRNGTLLYTKLPPRFQNGSTDINITGYIALTTSSKANVVTMSVRIDTNASYKLAFSKSIGYWYFTHIEITVGGVQANLTPTTEITAPLGFSYHCSSNIMFKEDMANLTFYGLQVEPFKTDSNNTFDDAYDCVPFFSAPIWAGIFVTFLLAFIMVWAITMIMDIKTMDQFDDPKGKTITISATE